MNKIEAVWKLMFKYDFEVDPDSINKNFRCIICKKLMIDAYESICGCQYCHDCICAYLMGERKCCPGKKTQCNAEFLILDKNPSRAVSLNNSICKLKVLCPNESCGSKLELMEMSDHLQICIKRLTECPLVKIGCDKSSETKDNILAHMESDVLIHMQLLIETINMLRNEIDSLKIDIGSLGEKLKVKMSEIEHMAVHMLEMEKQIEAHQNEVSQQKRQLIIQRQEIVEQNETMVEQMAQQRRDIDEQIMSHKNEVIDQFERHKLDIIAQIDERILESKKDLSEQMKHQNSKILEQKEELKIEMKMLRSENEKLKKEIENAKKECIKKEKMMEIQLKINRDGLEGKLTKLTMVTDKLKEETDRQRGDIDVVRNDGRTQLSELECSLTQKMLRQMINLRSLNSILIADFIWRIDEISKKIETMRGKKIHSEPFYSNNFKFCLSILILSNYKIVLNCTIMKGDNDDKVEWPMRRPVTLSIISQTIWRPYVTESYQYDTYKYIKYDAFARPSNDMNKYGIGSPITNYSSIKETLSVIIDDTIIVSCVIGDK